MYHGRRETKSIFASALHHARQVYNPPALASVIIEYPQTQVRISFNAHCTMGEEDVTTIVGTKEHYAPEVMDWNEQPEMAVHLENGSVRVP